MSYLKFVDLGVPEGQKTARFAVRSATAEIGQIRFYGAWRKYCFFPAPHTVFDSACLNEIVAFTDLQNQRRG
jgi:hypothetical protein